VTTRINSSFLFMVLLLLKKANGDFCSKDVMHR